MQIISVNHHNVTAYRSNSAHRHEKTTVNPPHQNKDAAIISERAKDLAAQLSGKIASEEMKESPAIEAGEEQVKAL
jgi:hypothetical protein